MLVTHSSLGTLGIFQRGTGLAFSAALDARSVSFPYTSVQQKSNTGSTRPLFVDYILKNLTRTLDTEREALPERKQFNPCSEGKHTAAAHTRTLQALKSAALGHPHLPRADLELTYCPLSLGFAPADHADPVPRAKWSDNYFPASQWQLMLSEHRLQPRAATLEPPWKGRR